ncbi:MAG: hypothetical protein ACKVT0_23215, partial [Planctomycetaceae bacterium]
MSGARRRINLREVLVPADDFEKWPVGDWQPISRRDFLSDWKLLQPMPMRPQSLWIGKAEYSAVLVDHQLQFGRGSWSINSREMSPTLLHLSPIELPLSNLKLNGQPAVWGNAPGGAAMLLVYEKSSTAEFEWSLKGDRRRHSVVFNIKLPSATASILQLNLPNHMPLETSRGVVTGPVAAIEDGWSRWTIDLGQETACQLTVREQSPEGTQKPAWLIQQETSYVVRQEGVQIQADLNVVLEGDPVQRFQIPIPQGVEVYTVAYGNDSRIPWTVSQDAKTKQSLVTLELPDPIRGAFRPIRLNCFAETRVDQDWSLPLFRTPGVLVQGNMRLTIESPLQLKRVHTSGCRIVNASSGNTTGATYQLVQGESDADVNIRVAFPSVDVTGKMMNHLQYDSPGWTWIAELSLNSQSGAAYQIRSLLPLRWDVIEVQLSEASAQQGQILKWVVEPADEEHQRLILDVARAIDPEHSLAVTIRSRQTPGIVEEKLHLPALQPVNYQLKESLFAVAPPGKEMPHIQLGPGMQTVAPASLSAGWSFSTLFQSLHENTPPNLWFLSSSTARESFLEFPQFRQGLTGRTTVEYDLFPDRLEERYFVRAEPLSEPIDRVLVYSTGTGPEFEWEQLTDRTIPLEAERLSSERHQNWNLPETGELWEIRLPESSQVPIHLRAQRVRYHAGQITGQLVFLPQTREFLGTIELNSSPGMDVLTQTSAYALQSQEKILPSRKPEFPVMIRRWEYDDLADQFEMRIDAESAEIQPSPMLHLKLQSRIFADGTGQNIHRARFFFSDDFRSRDFTYQLPPQVEWIATKVNGEVIQPQFRGSQHVIAVVAPDAASNYQGRTQVEVEYREPDEAVWLRERREVPLPKVDFSIVQFDWELELPAGFALDSIPRGMNGISEGRSLDWQARWFGPLGRASSSRWFNPLDLTVWRDLYHRLLQSTTSPDPDAAQETRLLWNRTQLQGRSVPASISIVVWNGNRLEWIGWLAFFSTLAIGGWIKVASPRILTGIGGAAWWTVLLVSIWFVEGPLSVVMGAAALGSLLAFFVPVNWLKRRNVALRNSTEKTLSTTLHLPSHSSEVAPWRGSVGLLILLVLSLGWKAAAQDPPAAALPVSGETRKPAPEPDDEAKTLAGDETWDVLIPYDEKGELNSVSEFVYVQSQTAQRLKDLTASLNGKVIDYLISSAEYTADWDPNGRVILTAKYKVAVLSRRETQTIVLPIEHAHLAREATCAVDGRTATVLMVPDRSGFMIEVSSPLSVPPPPLPEDPSGSESENSSEANAVALDRDAIHIHEIALSLYPAVKSTENGMVFEMQIPPVSDSRLLLRFPQLPTQVDVVGNRALGTAKFEANDYRVSLGRQSLMSVKWNREAIVP